MGIGPFMILTLNAAESDLFVFFFKAKFIFSNLIFHFTEMFGCRFKVIIGRK